MDKPTKKEIKRIIAQWINGEINGYCFGFDDLLNGKNITC